jgi:single-stranded-DNA-specific exonuclease
MGDLTALQAKAQELAAWVKGKDNFGVLYNYDCDGITAGSIVSLALERAGKQYNSLALKQIYSDTIDEIKQLGKNLIFVDFGSGQLDLLEKHFGNNFIVIDHHQPSSHPHPLHLNPMLFGFDGGTEISASGTSFLFAQQLGDNADLASLAIVGAVGDMQDQKGKLTGLNREILEQAIKAGVVSKKVDLRLYGRISRPLISFLCYSTSPILPQLTGSEENCSRFLSELDIELKKAGEWQSYEGLLPEDRRKLSSALILHLHKYNVPEWKIKELIGDVYSLEKEYKRSPLHDAKEFSTLCNACGRHGNSDIARRVCMGDRSIYLEKAMALLVQHRTELRNGIQLMQSQGVAEFKNFYFFDAEDKIKDSIIGIVAGMMYGSGNIPPNKPIIAFSRPNESEIKASGRGTSDLVRKGLNIGKAFKAVCGQLGEGAEGGGHAPAAGCKFPVEKKDEFLKLLDEKFTADFAQVTE